MFADAMGSVQRGTEVIEFATGAPHLLKGEHSESVGREVDAYSRRQPLGVCAGITPFNFPAMVPMWMFPIALACGNTFILKPSEKDPSPSIRMAELLAEAGLPAGVFNVVHGDKEAVDAHPASPWHRGGVVRRLDADREVHLRDGRGERQARAGARRREESRRRPARRRPRFRGGSDHRRGLRIGRRALHGDLRGGRGRRSRPIRSWRRSPTRAKKLKIGAGTARRWTWGRSSRRAHRDKVQVVRRRRRRSGRDRRRRRPRPGRARLREGLLPRADAVRSRHAGDDDLQGRDLRPRARGRARADARRGDRAGQRESVRQRHRDLHQLGRRGAQVRGGGRGRHGRRQRADSGADGVLFVRRLEAVAVRRPARPRHRRRQVLHAHEGGHDAAGRTPTRCVPGFNMPTMG